MRGSAPHPEAQRIFNIPRRRFSGSISGKISQGPQPPQAVPKAPLTDFSRLCFEAASDGDIYSFEPSPFPREGAEGMGSFRLTTFHQNGGKTLKRPLAYITAAWCGEPDTDMELAARYCRMAYEAGFSPICPILYLPLFINDAIPEEHKNGIDMRRDMLRRSHVLVYSGT